MKKTDLVEMITKNTCKWCDYDGLKLEDAEGYPHPGGYFVEEEEFPQWLYIECPKCGYAWALWKLGAPHPNAFKKENGHDH